MMIRYLLKSALVLIFVSSLLQAGDLRVNIVNGTTNQSGFADQVTLIDLATGMTPIASASAVNGSTTFSGVVPSGNSQYLIQGVLEGVTYSTVFAPSAGVSAWETTLTVFMVQDKVSDIHVTVPYFVIYAFQDRLYVQKRFVFENSSNPPVTLQKSPGTVKVHIPENITEMDYLTFKSSNMPLRTNVIDTKDGQVIPNALKPGVSEVDIAYYVPYEPAGTLVTENIDYNIDHFHVYTMPQTLNISAPGLSREGTDNENGLAIYALNQVGAGTKLDIQISGQGMSDSQPQQQQQQNKGRIVVEHRLPTSTKLVLSGVLIMGIFVALFISVTQQSADLKQESINMLKQQKQALLHEYAKATDSKADEAEQDKILHQLSSVYKTLDRIK